MPAPPTSPMIGVGINNTPYIFGQAAILNETARFMGNVTADFVPRVIFVCPVGQSYQVVDISEIHTTAGTGAGQVNLQVSKDTGTQAPGAGVDLLTNNTNAGFDLKGTANTLQQGGLTATTANLVLAAGDRISVDFAGILTTLAGVFVQVQLKRVS